MTTTTAPSLRVLYLEDNPVDADLTKRELARLAPEMQLEIVTTLGAALEQLAAERPPYDVILTDLCLPDGNGMELLAHVRERELQLAVVIITGSGDQDAAVAALKLGADDYLVKRSGSVASLPLVLHSAHSRFLANHECRNRHFRVLYAEPNAADVDLTHRYFAQHNPNIHLEDVSSGEDLLARLSVTAAEEQPFDLLLLDYRLPGLNALDVVKVVRQEYGLQIPIMMVTGHGDEDVALQALRLGVNEYLVKNEGYLQQLPVLLEKMMMQVELNRSLTEFRLLSQEFNGLLNAIPDCIMLLDSGLNILWANRTTAEKLGVAVEEMVGRKCYNLYYNLTASCKPCPVLNCFESGAPVNETIISSEGRILDVRTVPLKDAQGVVQKVINMQRDITEHRKLETQYFHAQKMESIGTLAGGVAHDFNNILSVIMGYGQILSMQMAKENPQRQSVEQILIAADRAAHLTRELLLFSRKQESELRPVDLNDVISKAEKFLRRLIGEDISLKLVVHDKSLPVIADSHQLEQVLMNLAVNARDAMPHGGEITLEVQQFKVGEDFIATHGYGKTGKYALLTVSDTGVGMDKETLQHIFEPFFTTKSVGKGTGLGLSVVYGIINQHDGFITAYSEPCEGSTFRVFLPLTQDAIQQGAGSLEQEIIPGGTETILLAEDDEMVRTLLTTVLTGVGYTVIAAVDGEDAVRQYREHAESIQLLLFDLIMPKMNGKEALDEIRKLRPEIRAIFASGYAPDIIRQKTFLDDASQIISKPVSSSALLKAVRGMLDK